MTIKEELLNLLEKDREFRLAVAGLIGLEEILKRLEQNDQQLTKLRKDMLLVFKKHREILTKHTTEITKLRRDMLLGFKKHDEALRKHATEIAQLRVEMVEGFKRHDKEIAKLRADMVEGFKRHDEKITTLGFDVEKFKRHISALGARWGIMSEAAFREGLKGILEREIGLKVERWVHCDENGMVYGYPTSVEVDAAIHNGKVTLIDVKSHVNVPDVSIFARKAELYSEKTGKTPSRKLMVTPYAEDAAIEAAKALNIEIYTEV